MIGVVAAIRLMAGGVATTALDAPVPVVKPAGVAEINTGPVAAPVVVYPMADMVSCSAVAVATVWERTPVNATERVFVPNPVRRQPVEAHSAWLPEPALVTAT